MLVKDIFPFILFGVALYFAISRPIEKYKIRKWYQLKYKDELPKLKWYEWWL